MPEPKKRARTAANAAPPTTPPTTPPPPTPPRCRACTAVLAAEAQGTICGGCRFGAARADGAAAREALLLTGRVPEALLLRLDSKEAAVEAVSGGRVASMLRLLPPPLLACAAVWESARAANAAQADEALETLAAAPGARIFAARHSREGRCALLPAPPAPCAVLGRPEETATVLAQLHPGDVQCCACHADLCGYDSGAASGGGKVWQCGNGHLLCELCDDRLGKHAGCPFCRQAGPRVRNLLAERLREGRPRPCRHCSRWLRNEAERKAHAEACEARLVACAVCNAHVPQALLDEHLDRRHAARAVEPAPGLLAGFNRFPLKAGTATAAVRLVFRLSSSPGAAVVVQATGVRCEADRVSFWLARCDARPSEKKEKPAVYLQASLHVARPFGAAADGAAAPPPAASVLARVASWAYDADAPPEPAVQLPLPRWLQDRRDDAALEIHLSLVAAPV
jgi:hypothetical protein